MALSDPPTRKQLTYLRSLAEQTGTTFSPPSTRLQARREIDRLKTLTGSSRDERRADRDAISRGLAEQQPASTVRDDEVIGYGFECQWSHSTRAPKSA